MDTSQALSLIKEVESDHHVWVDFNEDYYIGGLAEKKAEFVRDICSLASTITGKEKHYIVVGVDDGGEIVGTCSGSSTYHGSGPRHICSYDTTEIQDFAEKHIEPAPKITWTTYEINGYVCGLLTVDPLEAPPAVTKHDLYDDGGDKVLSKGLVFVRNRSGRRLLMALSV